MTCNVMGKHDATMKIRLPTGSKPYRKIGQRDESRKVKQPAKVVDGHCAQPQNPSDGYAKGRKDLCEGGWSPYRILKVAQNKVVLDSALSSAKNENSSATFG